MYMNVWTLHILYKNRIIDIFNLTVLQGCPKLSSPLLVSHWRQWGCPVSASHQPSSRIITQHQLLAEVDELNSKYRQQNELYFMFSSVISKTQLAICRQLNCQWLRTESLNSWLVVKYSEITTYDRFVETLSNCSRIWDLRTEKWHLDPLPL